jgi:tetratricopeptide (TPR) repeat protein
MRLPLYYRLPLGTFALLLLLFACAAPLPRGDGAPSIAPLYRVSHSPGAAHGYVLLAAAYEGQDRPERAEAAYREALDLDPDHADASDGLARLLAARGRFDEAGAQLRNAVRVAPREAKYFNNLGYVYHLGGNHVGAIDALRRALALDPHYARAWTNLAASCAKLGVLAQRRLVRLAAGPDPCAPRLVLPATAQRQADEVGAVWDDGTQASPWTPRYGWVDDAAGAAGAAPAGDAVPAGGAPAAARAQRLEIANGNGVPGLARRMAQALRADGLAAVRAVNLKPYVEQQSSIQFRAGFARAALELGQSTGVPEARVVLRALPDNVDLRLILGKDIQRAQR